MLIMKKLTVTGILTLIGITLLLAGCFNTNSFGSTKVSRTGGHYPPYNGTARIFWKEHGVPNPNRYSVIGRISGRTTWCGVEAAKFNTALHNWIAQQAAKMGGNGVIMYCGEVGTTGQCHCYGDAIRLRY
jgi:hypothetical protein